MRVSFNIMMAMGKYITKKLLTSKNIFFYKFRLIYKSVKSINIQIQISYNRNWSNTISRNLEVIHYFKTLKLNYRIVSSRGNKLFCWDQKFSAR
jgi:hypothetical protein